jgi:hypothetical protein
MSDEETVEIAMCPSRLAGLFQKFHRGVGQPVGL